jgi:hypothetical protein
MKAVEKFGLLVFDRIGGLAYIVDLLEDYWVYESSLEEEIPDSDSDPYLVWLETAHVPNPPYCDPTEIGWEEIDRIRDAGQKDGKAWRNGGRPVRLSPEMEKSPARRLIAVLGWEEIGEKFDLPIFEQDDDSGLWKLASSEEAELVKRLFCDLYDEAFGAAAG